MEADQRRRRRVEGAPLLRLHPRRDRGLLLVVGEPAQVLERHRDARLGVHPLHRLREPRQVERGAEHRVPRGQLLRRRLQRLRVGRSLEVVREDVVVRRLRFRVPAVEEHPQLEPRRRVRVHHVRRELGAVPGAHQREGGVRGPAGLRRGGVLQRAGDGLDGLPAEELRERHLHPRLASAGHHADAADGVAAQREEVVADPHLLHPQHLAPHPRQHALRLGARRHEVAAQVGARGVGGGEGAAVQLAVGGEREALQRDERRRDHVLREPRADPVAQLRDGGRGAGARDHVPHQPPVPRRVLARQDGGLADPRVLQERRLDLPQLDAEAADLDLVVDAPQVLQVAAGAEPRQVARAVQPRAGLPPERVGDEALRRQLRSSEVAARHPRPAHEHLPRHSRGHRLAVAVGDVHAEVRDRHADAAPPRPRHVLPPERAGR